MTQYTRRQIIAQIKKVQSLGFKHHEAYHKMQQMFAEFYDDDDICSKTLNETNVEDSFNGLADMTPEEIIFELDNAKKELIEESSK